MRRALVAVAVLLAAPTAAHSQQNERTEGEQIFQLVCSMCHSVAPPAKAAPPMSHAASYYLRKYPDTREAAAAIVSYLKQPAADRSAMPAHAIERFGLMPSQGHLADAQLQAVARYVLTLADTTHVHRDGGSDRPR